MHMFCSMECQMSAPFPEFKGWEFETSLIEVFLVSHKFANVVPLIPTFESWLPHNSSRA